MEVGKEALKSLAAMAAEGTQPGQDWTVMVVPGNNLDESLLAEALDAIKAAQAQTLQIKVVDGDGEPLESADAIKAAQDLLQGACEQLEKAKAKDEPTKTKSEEDAKEAENKDVKEVPPSAEPDNKDDANKGEPKEQEGEKK